MEKSDDSANVEVEVQEKQEPKSKTLPSMVSWLALIASVSSLAWNVNNEFYKRDLERRALVLSARNDSLLKFHDLLCQLRSSAINVQKLPLARNVIDLADRRSALWVDDEAGAAHHQRITQFLAELRKEVEDIGPGDFSMVTNPEGRLMSHFGTDRCLDKALVETRGLMNLMFGAKFPLRMPDEEVKAKFQEDIPLTGSAKDIAEGFLGTEGS